MTGKKSLEAKGEVQKVAGEVKAAEVKALEAESKAVQGLEGKAHEAGTTVIPIVASPATHAA